jgi:hypothetical protein
MDGAFRQRLPPGADHGAAALKTIGMKTGLRQGKQFAATARRRHQNLTAGRKVAV